MDDVSSLLAAWLLNRDLTFRQDGGIFDVPVPGATHRSIRLALIEDDGLLVAAMPLILRAPEAVRVRAEAELASRNADLLIGAWLRNEATGEIFFRTALPLDGLTDDAVWYVIRWVVSRVGGDTEAQWAEALGLQAPETSSEPEWADED